MKYAVEMGSVAVIRVGGLISLWLYKENKLRDWKNVFSYSTLSSTHLWLRCPNFFNPAKKNYFSCAANRKIRNRKSQRIISTPTYTYRVFHKDWFQSFKGDGEGVDIQQGDIISLLLFFPSKESGVIFLRRSKLPSQHIWVNTFSVCGAGVRPSPHWDAGHRWARRRSPDVGWVWSSW
jgi:hypothetical protein